MELLEDGETMLLGNPWAGVPDLDMHCPAMSTTAEQHLSAPRKLFGVRQQVAHYLLEQPRVAPHDACARHDTPLKALSSHMIAEVRVEMLEQLIQRKALDISMDDAGLELIDVEERVQHSRHDADRSVEAFRSVWASLPFAFSLSKPRSSRMVCSGCLRVMACRSKKPRFGDIGLVGGLLGGDQRFRSELPLSDVRESNYDPFDQAVMGSVLAK